MSEHSAEEWREYSKKYQTLGSEPFWQDLHDVIADLAACEAERNRHEKAALTAIEQRDVAEIRAERLVKYTNHTIPCAVGENKPCTCGLDAALADAEREGEGPLSAHDVGGFDHELADLAAKHLQEAAQSIVKSWDDGQIITVFQVDALKAALDEGKEVKP